jgi:hypothetical protein
MAARLPSTSTFFMPPDASCSNGSNGSQTHLAVATYEKTVFYWVFNKK